MDNITIKHQIKKKKHLSKLLNLIASLDETLIKFSGDKNDELTIKLKASLEETLSNTRKINKWLLDLEGLSGRKYRSLINNLIQKIEKPSYLEIGSWLGSTACSACFKNNLNITCIDNWSQNFTNKYNPQKEFLKNIKKCLTKKSQFKLISKNFRKINFKKIGKFNIYLYDGPHHLEDHFDAIKVAQPALNEKYLLIIDDWNWDQVRAGTERAINELKLNIISKLEIRTTIDGSNSLFSGESSDWHQGYCFFVIKK